MYLLIKIKIFWQKVVELLVLLFLKKIKREILSVFNFNLYLRWGKYPLYFYLYVTHDHAPMHLTTMWTRLLTVVINKISATNLYYFNTDTISFL